MEKEKDESENSVNQPGLEIILEDVQKIIPCIKGDISRLKGKSILITGAAGFLPGYLADTFAMLNEIHLKNNPAHLFLLTRRPITKESRLSHLMGNERVHFLIQDVCEPISISQKIDYIIHAASLASPTRYCNDPVGTLKANSLALIQLLDLALHTKSESFLFFSSSEVYGNPELESIPTPETYIGKLDYTSERACYAESKRFGEAVALGYFRQYGLPVKIVRPFHVYGPGLRFDDGRIIPEMIKQGIFDRQFVLKSNGNAKRAFCYVSDATVLFIDILLSQKNGEVFNVGADHPLISMLDLVKIIKTLFGGEIPIQVNSNPVSMTHAGAPNIVCPNLSKIKKYYNASNQFTIDEGLSRLIKWFQLQKELQT